MKTRQAKKIQRRTYRTRKCNCPYKISTMQEAEKTLERAWKRRTPVRVDAQGRRWRAHNDLSVARARMTGFWLPYRALRKHLGPERWRRYRETGEL